MKINSRKSARKSARKSSRKTSRKSVRKSVRKSRKTSRKSVRKSVRKSSRKTSRKHVRKAIMQRSRSRLRKLIDLAKFEHVDWDGKSQTPAEAERIAFRNSIRMQFYFFIMMILFEKFSFIYKYGLATPDYVTRFSTLKRTTLITLQEASKGAKTMTLEVFTNTLERLSKPAENLHKSI